MDIFEKAKRLKELSRKSKDFDGDREQREAAAIECVDMTIDVLADFFDDISRIANALEKADG